MTSRRFLLCFGYSARGGFFGNRSRELLPPIATSMLAKIEQIYESVFEIFGDEVLELIKTAKKVLLR